jgi:hypothetical protein
MRVNSLMIVVTTAISGVTAIDKIGRQATTCISYAVTNNSWTEDNLRRRRVVYDTTKNLVQYDQVMYSIGWMWSNEKERKSITVSLPLSRVGRRSCFEVKNMANEHR